MRLVLQAYYRQLAVTVSGAEHSHHRRNRHARICSSVLKQTRRAAQLDEIERRTSSAVLQRDRLERRDVMACLSVPQSKLWKKQLEAAWRREIGVVLVRLLDRWERSLTDLRVTLQELKKLGIGFVLEAEALGLTTPTGRAMSGPLRRLRMRVLGRTRKERTRCRSQLGKIENVDRCPRRRRIARIDGHARR